VTTQRHTNSALPGRPRPSRCHRHSVWMAACTDCRAAHAPLLAHAQDTAPAGR